MKPQPAPPAELEFHSAHKIAMEAIEKMVSQQIPPAPKNFAVWYAYFSQTNPELSRAIDIMAKSSKPTGSKEIEQLYESFLHEKLAEGQTMTKVNSRLQETLTHVQSMINEAGSQTSQFNSTLGDAAGKLDGNAAPDAIKSIVGQLVNDAKAMMAQNEALQKKLAESSAELVELKQDLVSVREEALTDGLTGIFNRKAFDMRLLQAAAEATSEGEPMCLLLVDIDFFKKFNDTHGHQAGDQIIRLVAQTFQRALKGQDTAARYGGEEFGIILPNTVIENAARVGEILRNTVAHKEVINRVNQQNLGQITISVGVAQYRHGEALETMIERAD
ncbi:MAG TPA: GGDEF domain-containing protein, partial [Rhodospirillaceae bacterium]|nr:GGDEF domain-containing protein [Rhodospirillaceae bacterium]